MFAEDRHGAGGRERTGVFAGEHYRRDRMPKPLHPAAAVWRLHPAHCVPAARFADEYNTPGLSIRASSPPSRERLVAACTEAVAIWRRCASRRSTPSRSESTTPGARVSIRPPEQGFDDWFAGFAESDLSGLSTRRKAPGRLCGASRGGCSPHKSSMSRSRDTTSLAFRSSNASSARCLSPPNSSRTPSRSASNWSEQAELSCGSRLLQDRRLPREPTRVQGHRQTRQASSAPQRAFR